jgi:predicted O-methyltransferase YrrM
MNTSKRIITLWIVLVALSTFSCYSQQSDKSEIDRKVEAFLDKHSRSWYDMNIPASDGKLLYDLITKNNYKSALEIGTSTGHSSIWIAWALSKTGGKLITVELDERRHNQAVANFKEAGLEHIIDARLGNAHELVPELDGPFDFVFSDADKYWYKNYFLAVDPKLEVDGCYTTHNVSDRGGRGQNRDYLQFLLELDHYETTVDNRGGGMAISYKTSAE